MPTSDQQLPQTISKITATTVISRSPAVLTAEADGEIVMMSIEHGCYFELDAIGSDI